MLLVVDGLRVVAVWLYSVSFLFVLVLVGV